MRPDHWAKRAASSTLAAVGIAILISLGIAAVHHINVRLGGDSPSRREVTACAKIVADDLRLSAQTADYMRAAADGLQPKDFLTTLCDGKPNCNNHK